MRLAASQEAFVAGLAGRFRADGSQGCHVEQVAGLCAPAADAAPAAVLSGIAVERCEAKQAGGLAAAEAAEFGHVGAEAGGIDGATAGDRLDDGVTTGEFGVGGDTGAHPAIAGFDVGLEGLERGGGAASGLGAEFGAELAQGTELLDELAAEGEQVAELLEVALLGRGALETGEEAEAGEHGRINAVVLGALADGFGKSAGSARG